MIRKLKAMYLRWRDEQDLKDIQRLIRRVFRNEPIGSVVELNGKKYVIEDITLSMRKNMISSKRTLFRSYATQRQRSAMNKLMNERLQKTPSTYGQDADQ